MAKNDAPKPKKQRWYSLIIQAYKVTAPHDKLLLPGILAILIGGIALAVVIGLIIGGTAAIIYASIFGVLTAALGAMYFLTRRFERNAFMRMEGQTGASLAVAQTIRSGWKFEDQPVNMDTKGKGVVFQGVGKGGIVLLAEGGSLIHRPAETSKKRIEKLVPGVPVTIIYVGRGDGEVALAGLTKAIRRIKKALGRNDRPTVEARLKAIGGAKPPMPKGIDPVRARPDRKGMRGR
ncbi:DUF4191 domain-containing protein [Demequina sp. SYSU T00192]|uniref:DUF4191 domain-containing protein n=1 Tax=Demequina litoralis TaxID=3051660 RepID=A0ABT8G662_9MICO|nr:DUF4191 domain-containing protein [Demequina sp. SYSU T00192]MDN4474629.1 DUF4191 domain-containing protein [Demequina sp. SYSU T00192]